MTIARHKLVATSVRNPACNCGYDPITLELAGTWQAAVRAVLAHIKKSRHWEYKGVETHYGMQYHLWENELTNRKFAWPVELYRADHAKALA